MLAIRDIKGANIFLTDDMKNLKLGDYGSAVKIKQHTTMPGELQGHVGTQGMRISQHMMQKAWDTLAGISQAYTEILGTSLLGCLKV